MAQAKTFAVIGHPVTHSLSPRIHSFWYECLGLAATYTALDLTEENVVEDIRALARAGFAGLNVTLPHKLAAFEASENLSDAARLIGAVNTLVPRVNAKGQRTWLGENTDWTGFLWSLDRMISQLPEEVVLLGAGGAARAVAYALKSRGVTLLILNRTPEKAQDMVQELNLDVSRVTHLDELPDLARTAPLVVNTISLGHSGGELMMPMTDSGVFMDISYGKAADATLANAARSGWKTEDGLPMLIGQAADAFHLWFGIQPDRDAAIELIRSSR